MGIDGGKPHQGKEAITGYRMVLQQAVRQVRKTIPALVKSRKPDLPALGAIHALRVLAEVPFTQPNLTLGEVEEWEQIGLAWLKRVESKIPEEHRADYRRNCEEDFHILKQHAINTPESIWRDNANFEILEIPCRPREIAQAKAYAESHKASLLLLVKQYLQRLGESASPAPPPKPKRSPGKLTIFRHPDGVFAVMFDAFSQLRPGTVNHRGGITGYELQKHVQNSFDQSTLDSLQFDSESSSFVCRSSSPESITAIVQHLLDLLTPPEAANS